MLKIEFKVLVPSSDAHKVLGSHGCHIRNLQKQSGCEIEISGRECHYPGTNHRILYLKGSLENICHGIDIIMMRLMDCSSTPEGPFSIEVVLSLPAVFAVLNDVDGKFRELKDSRMFSVNVGTQVGEEQLACISSTQKMKLVRATQHLFGDLHASCPALVSVLSDDCWLDSDVVKDPSCALIDPRLFDISCVKKHALIEYLQKAAPKTVLLQHSLHGDIKNLKKRHNLQKLLAAVSDTWNARIVSDTWNARADFHLKQQCDSSLSSKHPHEQ